MISVIHFVKLKIVRYCLKSLYSESEAKDILVSDIERWVASPSVNIVETLEQLFLKSEEFRSLFFYRLKIRNLRTEFLHFFYRPLPTLYICTRNIGPGLFIQHGFSTIIAAKSIGRNCWINQQVTIGFSDATHCPEIGDDVTINAGALIIGGVVIGDRAKIGAGAVVVKSVPSDCTVVGNPAYIVRRNGVRVTEKL